MARGDVESWKRWHTLDFGAVAIQSDWRCAEICLYMMCISGEGKYWVLILGTVGVRFLLCTSKIIGNDFWALLNIL
jgi:hypothetical protein